jgi:hypothetical protein
VTAILVAVALAWWQARQSRKQQQAQWLRDVERFKISSRPHVTIEEITQRDAPQLQIIVRNTGMGPAIFTKFEMLIDGEPVYFDRSTFWQRFVRALDLPPGVDSGGTVLAEGQALPANAERMLLRYRPADVRQVDNTILLEKLKRVDYEVTYKSIYGEEFAFRSRNTDSSVSFCLGPPEEVEPSE